MKIADIKTIVSLTLARLDIVKLKHADGGYLWSTVNEEGKKQIESALVDIDKLLLSLSKPDSPSPTEEKKMTDEKIKKLKERFYEECTGKDSLGCITINTAPHNVFQWFVDNVIKAKEEDLFDDVIEKLESRERFAKPGDHWQMGYNTGLSDAINQIKIKNGTI